jgi:hypothetical protein
VNRRDAVIAGCRCIPVVVHASDCPVAPHPAYEPPRAKRIDQRLVIVRIERVAVAEVHVQRVSVGRVGDVGHPAPVIDHVVANVALGDMDGWSEFYERLGFS